MSNPSLLPTTPAQFRPPTHSDLRQIAALWFHALQERRLDALPGSIPTKADRHELFDHVAKCWLAGDPFVVAIRENRVVGFAIIEFRDYDRACPFELTAWVVDPAWRGRGIGRALLEAVEYRLSLIGKQGFMVWVAPDEPLLQSIRSLGGERIEIDPFRRGRIALVAYGWRDSSKIAPRIS